MVGETFFPTSGLYQNCSSTNFAQNGWNQTPPSCMPWGSLPLNQITRFSGETPVGDMSREPPDLSLTLWNPSGTIHSFPKCSKRKSGDLVEAGVLDEPFPKQLITEEKIASHLSRLHISGSDVIDEPLYHEPLERPLPQKTKEDDILERMKLKNGSRIVFSEEFRGLRQESVLPPSLIEHLTKPSMAVVLWQPPGRTISNIISAALSNSSNHATGAGVPGEELNSIEEDSNNNEPMTNLNANPNIENQAPDVYMQDQDL